MARSRQDVEREAQPAEAEIAAPTPDLRQPLSPASVLALQRTAGNAAVARLLSRQPVADTEPAVADTEPAVDDWPGLDESAEESASAEAQFDDDAIDWAELEDTAKEVLTGAAGVAYGSVQTLAPGGFMAPSPAPENRTFEFFRGAGQFATGLVTLVAGGAGEVGGLVLDATGVGLPAGVALNVVSAAVMAQGVASMAAGVATLSKAAKMSGKGQQSWLPKKGTPERAAVENARRTGIRRKQQLELENIRGGGKGSGVWTEKELAKIRKTGKFPKDTRWHHDPPVALRPDRAADPAAVRPVRGGHAGHLEAHGGDFRPK
jgi:hypothetical protein